MAILTSLDPLRSFATFITFQNTSESYLSVAFFFEVDKGRSKNGLLQKKEQSFCTPLY